MSRSICSLLGAAAITLLVAGTAQAQNPHVGHVATGFPAAPDGAGLLATAQAEAEVARTHVRLAMSDPSNLAAVKVHAGHALHALDPAEGSQGPGKGFGVKRAAEGVAQHIGLAAQANGATPAITTHATHIAASATTAANRAAEAADVARRIQQATTYAEGETLLAQLQALTTQIVEGRDANGDGTVGWQEGEGGLAQAEQHLGFLQRAGGQ